MTAELRKRAEKMQQELAAETEDIEREELRILDAKKKKERKEEGSSATGSPWW